MTKKLFAVIISSLIIYVNISAQVAISVDDSAPDFSTIMDIQSINRGLLIPQIALTDKNDASTISNPSSSLLIYNTSSNEGLSPGFYLNRGTKAAPDWIRIATGINDGSECSITEGTNISIIGSGTNSDPYTISTTSHYIGELFGGGIVFYVDETGQHGLIAATSDNTAGFAWNDNGSIPYDATNAIKNGFGAGAINTNRIISVQGEGDYAALVCAHYEGGGFGDWYLPSIYELQLMYAQEELLNLVICCYWSSNEENTYNAYYMGSSSSGLGIDFSGKINEIHSRPIRSF